MASGFLILVDGRCFSRVSRAHDAVIRAVAEQLGRSGPARALHEWLLSLVSDSDCEADLGYAWVRKSNGEHVRRVLDVRELTNENQRLFHEAARKAASLAQAQEPIDELPWLRCALVELGDMVERADRGEPPMERSDWREVRPSEGKRIGPGW